MFDITQRDIKYLVGVGPTRADILSRDLNIKTFHDLLYYFPYKYIDRSKLYSICELNGEMAYVQFKGEIISVETIGEGRNRRLVAHVSDHTGIVDLVWFQGIKYVQKSLKPHTLYLIFGKPSVFGGRINVSHPDLSTMDSLSLSDLGLQAYYNTSEKMKRSGLNSAMISKLVQNLFDQLKEPLAETLPEHILAKYKLAPLMESLRMIHFPKNNEEIRRAQYRLKFEELFYIQLNIIRYASDRQRRSRGFVFSKVGEMFNSFYNHCLPFPLTGAQKRVIKEIRGDMGSGRQMNRLLQGDVGSGKTLVALMTSLLAVDNGYQACIMAPTEILAEQHSHTIREQLSDLPVRLELLTGSVKGKKREEILNGVQTGEVKILVGTHAVLEDTVLFKNLGFVVIDEQHRFGVAQRARLWNKNVIPPHVLVMTATPIPRTLAMTLYGDLDVSVIDELPPGRKPVQTLHMFDNRRKSLYDGMRQQIGLGRQVYVVYPLIKENEKLDLLDLEKGFEQIQAQFPEFRVCMVHGKMKPAEKDLEMKRFLAGESNIMVATTVIEVGVNVPNASVMIIQNAERFGLSQLHQLRGRVGRGADQSYCILVTGNKLSEITKKRIQIMTETNDGFEIAEADLKLRGPGDLEGTQQSGLAFDLHIANIVKDSQLLEYVRNIAHQIVEEDTESNHPENAILWQQLAKMRKDQINWSEIS
ncbi:MAG: ATP-dependent DNA helicase RecG [Bacteroidaceae bacterium]|nr:ATP-dependent DNA helicase RecG [Bacteroidaceae bacterium]